MKIGVDAKVMSALRMDQVCEYYVRRNALEYLRRGEVVILAAGTGILTSPRIRLPA